jgi:hypothetical protein
MRLRPLPKAAFLRRQPLQNAVRPDRPAIKPGPWGGVREPPPRPPKTPRASQDLNRATDKGLPVLGGPSSLTQRILTLEDLAMAISNRIGIEEEDAVRDANFVMDIFGFDDRVIDNVLEPEDRQLFYILEEEGMLTTEREETTLYDGREWRTHYWLFKKNQVFLMSEEEREVRRRKKAQPTEATVYSQIPEEAWASRQI